jgi:ParB family chromosome partitioning protein
VDETSAKPEAEARQNPRQAIAAHVEPNEQEDAMNRPSRDKDDRLTPIPNRLMSALATQRTLALRSALGEQPKVAFLALSALCLKVFWRRRSEQFAARQNGG